LEEVDEEFDGFKDEVVEDTSEDDAVDPAGLGDMVAEHIEKGDPTRANHQVDPGAGIGICENTDKEFVCETMGDLAGDCPHCGDPISYIDEDDLEKSHGPVSVTKETYTDYPDAASENARMALEARESTGNPNDCGTDVGWARANQLAGHEPISRETVGRMAAFDRHRENSEMDDDEGEADCGWMMWKAWGGDAGVDWAIRKLDSLEEQSSAGVQMGDIRMVKREGYWTIDDGAGQSGGGSGNVNAAVSKDEPLRETTDWQQFDVQPSDVEQLQQAIADDVRDLFDAVLDDGEIMSIIERLAAGADGAGSDDTTAKSLTDLGRRLRELFTESDVVARIEDAIRSQTSQAAQAAIETAVTVTDEDPDIDVDAIEAQLNDREVHFADSFADQLRDEIRDTVGDGWAEGKNTREIAEDIAAQADISEGWGGAERIARQELHIATGHARSEFAADIGKVEVWQTSEDTRVRPAHDAMNGQWKRPSEDWVVNYSEVGRGVQKESVPGDSEPGIGCRCTVLLRDRDVVDDSEYAGDGALN
jgi:hypothetical protein